MSARPLLSFFASVRKHSAASYGEKHPHPVLLYLATITTDADRTCVTTETSAIGELRRTQGSEAGRLGLEQRAALVRKRLGTGEQITIGRGPESDVVIPEPTVSKVHASLEARAEAWWLDDLDSANGTFLAGERVGGNGAVAIADDATIALGTCAMRFLLPRSFHAYVSAILQRTEPA